VALGWDGAHDDGRRLQGAGTKSDDVVAYMNKVKAGRASTARSPGRPSSTTASPTRKS
jgi:hypothetical protein